MDNMDLMETAARNCAAKELARLTGDPHAKALCEKLEARIREEYADGERYSPTEKGIAALEDE